MSAHVVELQDPFHADAKRCLDELNETFSPEVQTLSIVLTMKDGSVVTFSSLPRNSFSIVGGLESLKYRVIQDATE